MTPWTRLSFLILGAGNLARKQIVKGLLFLAVEIAYIVYMATAGVGSLGTLASLGSRTRPARRSTATGTTMPATTPCCC